jgi:hypothetical protein
MQTPRRAVRKQPSQKKEPKKEPKKTLKSVCRDMLDELKVAEKPKHFEPIPVTAEEEAVLRMMYGPRWDD